MQFQKRRVSDEIPTASMADITFLLIVYFMVTTTFAATRGLDFALPKEDDTRREVVKEEAVLIEIHQGGAVEVDGRTMAPQLIIDYLKTKLERNPLKPVIIRPDPDSAYGDMVEVFDELRQGAERGVEVKNISIPLPGW